MAVRPHRRRLARIVDLCVERQGFHCEWASLGTELRGPDIAEAEFDLMGFIGE